MLGKYNGTFTPADCENLLCTYTGEFVEGLFEGYGECIWDDGNYSNERGHFSKGLLNRNVYELFACQGLERTNHYDIIDKSKNF